MTELQAPALKREDALLRAFAIMASGVLLNIGLFFILGILTPLFTGLIVGYIIGEGRISPLASTLSTLIAYSIMFTVTSGDSAIILLIEAILIMVLIGTAGGYLGYYIRTKSVISEH